MHSARGFQTRPGRARRCVDMNLGGGLGAGFPRLSVDWKSANIDGICSGDRKNALKQGPKSTFLMGRREAGRARLHVRDLRTRTSLPLGRCIPLTQRLKIRMRTRFWGSTPRDLCQGPCTGRSTNSTSQERRMRDARIQKALQKFGTLSRKFHSVKGEVAPSP
jgi:hypothetical protein